MFGAGSVIFIMLEVKLVNIRWPGGRRRVGNEQVPTALVGANAALRARFHTGSLPHHVEPPSSGIRVSTTVDSPSFRLSNGPLAPCST